MTTQLDPKASNPGIPYGRKSDKLVSAQLVGTVCAIVFGFIATQWNIGNLIASQSTTNAELRQKVQSLTDDVKEIKETLHDLQRGNFYYRNQKPP